MFTNIMMVALLHGGAPYLECQVSDRGARLPDDAPYTLAVALSSNPDLYHVETRGADFRTSTLGVGGDAREWWWDDWRGGVMGRSHVDRITLTYRLDRGGRHAVGRCRKRDTPLWFSPAE